MDQKLIMLLKCCLEGADDYLLSFYYENTDAAIDMEK